MKADQSGGGTTVLLHPVGLDGDCWRLLPCDLLAGAVRYDLLWHGNRGGPSGPLTLASLAQDVLDRVDGPMDLVGLSLGGAVAQEIAVSCPDRVRSLLTACSPARTPNVIVAQSRAEAVEARGMSGVVDDTLARWFSPAALEVSGHPGVRYVRDRLLRDNPDSFAAAWRVLADRHSPERLRELRISTTVLVASDDASVSDEAGREPAELIPGARLMRVPGPHLVPLERPAVFAAALAEHLTWVRSGRTQLEETVRD